VAQTQRRRGHRGESQGWVAGIRRPLASMVLGLVLVLAS